MAFIFCCNLGFSRGVLARNISSSTLSVMMDSQHHEYVDLGLPSGTLWATCNVGADNPWEYGDYFAWGEISPKSYYWWDSYKWIAYREPEQEDFESSDPDFSYITKYVYSLTGKCWDTGQGELLSEDDAATVLWGDNWCTPSKEQIRELSNMSYTFMEKCTVNGVSGLNVKSKINGNCIFLPSAGLFSFDSLQEVGEVGYYWSRTGATSRSSYHLRSGYNGSSIIQCSSYGRHFGMSIRPVHEPLVSHLEQVGTTFP